MRQTKQRRAIVEVLATLDTHPTAEEFFPIIRRRLPNISLGSVYRNLEVLADAGLIAKLESGNRARRFDGLTTPHAHVGCPQCGAVHDLWSATVDAACLQLDQLVASLDGLEGYRLEFIGSCDQCTVVKPPQENQEEVNFTFSPIQTTTREGHHG